MILNAINVSLIPNIELSIHGTAIRLFFGNEADETVDPGERVAIHVLALLVRARLTIPRWPFLDMWSEAFLMDELVWLDAGTRIDIAQTLTLLVVYSDIVWLGLDAWCVIFCIERCLVAV
jgi:hypothetical protein